MIDMLKNAKDLIAKGKAIGDAELIQMGMDLLSQYDVPKAQPAVEQDQYVCGSCGYTMVVDKQGRKRCPECKKHQLKIKQAVLPEVVESKPVANPYRAPADGFRTQIRNKKGSNHTRYNETGEQEGTYTHSEQIEGVTNVWDDNEPREQDDANEQLKKFTTVSARTRKSPKSVEVKCENCNTVEHMHPIHASGRSRHLCQKCIRRRSQF